LARVPVVLARRRRGFWVQIFSTPENNCAQIGW
jgi:hypothetical protein